MRHTRDHIGTLGEAYKILRGLEDKIGDLDNQRDGDPSRTLSHTELKAQDEILKARSCLLDALCFLKAQAFDEETNT